MAGVRFADVQARPTEFLHFTSLTLEEFQILLPPFETAFQAHMAAWRFGGRVHDKRIAETTPSPLPAGSQLLQDLDCLAFTLPQVDILMPMKNPRGAELTLEQKLANQALHHRRYGSNMSTAA